ncbi:MAG: hypothetical protein WD749_06550 [Phycisphaerales bacterium]
MAARTGELAGQTGEVICQRCGEHVPVREGEAIPRCPNCAHNVYTGQGVSFSHPLGDEPEPARRPPVRAS